MKKLMIWLLLVATLLTLCGCHLIPIDSACSACRGSGKCSGCNGGGSCAICRGTGRDRYTDCTACDGLGNCQHCDNGTVDWGMGYSRNCTMCGGTRDCYTCKGTGDGVCSACRRGKCIQCGKRYPIGVCSTCGGSGEGR